MRGWNVRKFGVCGLFCAGLLLLASSQPAVAQVASSITGRVEDPSGAAIPAATVTVSNVETGATRTVAADEAGNFRALSLPVGQYELRAEKVGFKAAVRSGVNLVVGQQAVVNLRLEVGTVQEEVTVTGEAPLVNTTTASMAGLVGEKQVKDLPLNGRSFDLLITLNAGAINYTAMKSPGPAGGNFFSVAGRRPSENLTLLNGIEYTGASTVAITPGGVSGQLLGIDAVREYNVVSGPFSAEYGKRAGAQVSVVTQSGTNQLHGNVFEFLRNSKLDARNFFDQASVPPFKRNQFGGSLGGPIRKDKTFIFGNYEGFRQRLGVSNATFVPDLNARQGLLPCNAITPAPTSCPASGYAQVPGLNSNMLKYFAYWPEPNAPSLGKGIALNYSNPKQSIREDFGTARFDQTFSGNDSFSVVDTTDDGDNLTPTTDPIFAQDTIIRGQVVSAQETHVFSPQVINTFTAGFSRSRFANVSAAITALPANLGFVTGKPFGTIIVSGGDSTTQASSIASAGGNQNPVQLFNRNLFTYSDSVQIIKGKHQISMGVWLQRLQSNDSATSRAFGQASFASLQTFLQGTIGTFTVAPRSVPQGWRSWEGAWYLQDSVQVTPRLNIRFGLRHEFSNGWSEAHGRAPTFLFDSNGLIETNPRVSDSVLTQNNSKWLLGPRVGLAWDPFGKGKTSIRAGAGTYYNQVDTLSFLLDSSPPFNGAASYSNIALSSIVPVDPSLTIPPSCGPGVPNPCTLYQPKSPDPGFKVPTVESWNLTVEQQLAQNLALQVSYVGSRTYHNFVNIDPNAIPAQICSNPAGCTAGGTGTVTSVVPQGAQYIPVGKRPNPYLSFGNILFSRGNGSYNALQVELVRRAARGLQFRANYTWSKNLDSGSGTAASQSVNEAQTVLDSANLRRDWGPAALNVTHQASGNISYELPFGEGRPFLNGVHGLASKLISGWQVNSIITLLSGFPFTPTVGSNRSGNGDGNNPDRPSINPAFNGNVIVGKVSQWFDPNAFILPAAGTFGNAGRGVLRGPGLTGLDFSLFKNTRFNERYSLQIRAEVFNFPNHANLGTPNSVAFSGGTVSSSAGIITYTATSSRQVQFGMKLMF